MKQFFIILPLIWLTFPISSFAGEENKFVPKVPKALGIECVRDTKYMRENHMDFLFQKRDLVVLEGIRSNSESLNNCLACHAVTDMDGHIVSYDNSQHFCRTCHDFAAVKIDCFECHSSVPDQNKIIGVSNER